MQARLDAKQPKGRRCTWKSEYLPRIESALGEKAIKQAEKIRSPHSAVILFQIGGALNRVNEDYSAAGNRDARYVLNLAGSGEEAGDDREALLRFPLRFTRFRKIPLFPSSISRDLFLLGHNRVMDRDDDLGHLFYPNGALISLQHVRVNAGWDHLWRPVRHPGLALLGIKVIQGAAESLPY
jgi:hypothetical protein